MTNIVKGLEEARLVRRRPHESDGRAVLLEATAAGRRILDRGRRLRIDAIAERLADLGPHDLAILRRAGELVEERFALRPWQLLVSPGRPRVRRRS
jgi:DNA-binding MarR family transcriptional regulator